ncbi:hypothetical protein I552_5221 [Mycobacterium xenopi 3993]|nr:hypothetical protein I552_5221 [Mycobacterium xenopi 3993]
MDFDSPQRWAIEAATSAWRWPEWTPRWPPPRSRPARRSPTPAGRPGVIDQPV